MKRITKTLGLATVVAVLAFAPSAFAQNASSSGYGGQSSELVAVSGGSGSGGGSGTSSGGSLPFTGLDVGLAAGGGLLLLLIGLGMSRALSREPQS